MDLEKPFYEIDHWVIKAAADSMGFASGGGTCKLGSSRFYSSVVLVDSFVLRNRQLLKRANR
ncbi:MAG: hypothetical protein JNM78_12670 [Cyclobacteriaceae bacterium]|nr:hypothetical protein [Cyclobacteriaceae bacterium]